ncbi:hypothetical protein K440DRAFT_658095 [Wilcoxina mikolae CBS 423.85]|nr:hypothetical protein K440DRAFT_658095 [Wilcoxina mikolae CBS 423.85]
MDNLRRESKASFFDRLYSLHEGVVSGDEDEGASFDLSLGSRRFCTGAPLGRVKITAKNTILENKGPLKLTSTSSNSATHVNAGLDAAAVQKLPEHLRFKFVDEKAPKTPRKATTSKIPAQKSLLFQGMYFYFIPNNLKNLARKLKVQRAHEHGAFCASGLFVDCEQAITHIVVDSNFKYTDILKALGLDRIPAHIIVVKDTYPSDCLQYRRIVDHAQSIYVVPGRERSATPAEPSAHSTPGSLQIKAQAIDTVQETPRVEQTSSSSNSSSDSNVNSSYVSSPTSQEERIASDVESGSFQRSEPSKYKDDLELMIGDAKKMPLLDQEDDASFKAYEDDSEDEIRESPRKKPRKTKKGTSTGFQCMKKNDGSTKNANPKNRTIQVLSEMEQYYTKTQDEWRSMGYRKAIATLRKQNRKISFASEAIELPNIGSRLAEKIEEIVHTDSLKRLQYAKLEPDDATLKLFLGIYGVGLKHARTWVAAGHKTLQDLLDKEKLTESQRIGIEHHADFAVRIPRDEVQKHGEIVIKTAKDIDDELKLEIMGSYRRGAKDCGDIDVMITKENAEGREMKVILDKLVNKLTEMGFLKCDLATPRQHDDGSKWHGASQLSPDLPWRRIDFLIVPWAERGAAMLYFTGNDIFNRSMRLLASKKKFRLNQRGLYKDVIRGSQRQKINEGTLVEGESEEKIFEILGIPYRPPEDRNC